MTVRELIEVLQKENPDDLVILQIDPEGNGYRRVSGAEACHYDDDIGEVENAPDAEDEGKDWADGLTPAVVIYP